MAVTQSTFLDKPPLPPPGVVANGEKSNRLSRTVEDAAGIPFGRAVFRGAGDHGCTATPAADAFLGVTITSAGEVQLTGSQTVDAYQRYASAGLLNEGVIWITAGAATTPGQAAYVDGTGAFTTSEAATPIPATFDDTAAQGAPCRLRITRQPATA